MSKKLGANSEITRKGTIKKYNNDGTVIVVLNDVSLLESEMLLTIPLTSTWINPGGSFIGGYPAPGSTVSVIKGQGGQWYILNYLAPQQTASNFTITPETNPLSSLKPDRALMQVRNGIRIFLDPKTGIEAGSDSSSLQIDTNKNIIRHNFNQELSFTESNRIISGIVKRDISDNANRNITCSTLDSLEFDSTLTQIGMDPLTSISLNTVGSKVRNLPFVEDRKLIYEFANSYEFTTDQDEFNKYQDSNTKNKPLSASRRDNRADALSLSLESPNQLIESIQGTVVDAFGNILDINRNILPIGKIDELSLRGNSNKSEAFANIRAQLRKSTAFHWELNARKGDNDYDVSTVRDVSDVSNYSRKASKLFVDIDKEGQFKINIPASSETGNIPLLTRYENFSTLQSKEDGVTNPNEFLRSDTLQDVFLENFAGYASIKLSSTDSILEGAEGPIDRITDEPIKLGTAYHNIIGSLLSYQANAPFREAEYDLVNFDKGNRLNKPGQAIILDDVVKDTLIVSGPGANAGGRSGTINLDGFLSLNIGANTVDRQSLWLDTAGGVVSNIGRDSRGISYAASLDGDVLIQVGGPGIDNKFDSRFENSDAEPRNGNFEIRVFLNGQLTILKLGPKGIDIVSPGTITLTSQQDMIFKSNASMKFEAENIVMHAETSKRIIEKYPGGNI